MAQDTYRPEDFGKKEVEMMRKFHSQHDDAERYFKQCIKPRLDRSYKLYIAWNGDRAKQIQSWQANIFVPYIHSVVETLMPRILDARPEFAVQGRTEEDQMKGTKQQDLADYTWEIAGMDATSETLTRSSLIFGSSYLQPSWKKDVREHKFLDTKDITSKRPKWVKKKQTFYDAPFAECVDNYSLWYDWHNIPRESKQFWFKRLILTEQEIKRKYPGYDPRRLKMAIKSGAGDLSDFGSIRNEVKLNHEEIKKGSDYGRVGGTMDIYETNETEELKMHEVFEWWRPFDDEFSIVVNDVPILHKGFMPNPYDHKAAPFIDIPYLKMPHEFEGYGIPLLLENPQIMLNMVKNQRLDAATLNIHKMWIVNPLANIDKKDLVTRPFGIIYSTDPNGVREVEFSDVKSSSYREEELLKSDMRYASGVDDFSMGTGGGAGSATEVRHLRESTLERVRLFVNHLGDAYGEMMRMWMSMQRQFFTADMTIRVIGEDGREQFPLIEQDDLMGNFDYKAAVKSSIAGKNDIDKKQGMDLFQLLINLPFVDPRKLTSKVLHSWDWALDSISKQEEPQGMPGMPGEEGMPGAEGMPPGAEGQLPPALTGVEQGLPSVKDSGAIPEDVIRQAIELLGGATENGASPFAQAASPINLLESGGLPPTASPIGKTSNPRGLNRGGGVNTNIPVNSQYSPDNTASQAANIQK